MAAATAITLLSRAQYLPALPDIRKAAESEDTDLRHAALVALGVFGHPDDFAMLLSGRAEPAYETLVVWPLPPDGYGRVTISRQAALDWYTGKLNDADFKATRTIE